MILDLTHCISPEMPVYPGTEQPVLTTACTIREAGYRETILHMYSHTGTHMDAPAHMIEGGRTLDAFPAETFAGPGFVLDCRGLREIPLSLLRAHEDEIRRADFLLFCTDWDKRWGRAEYYEGFPCLTPEAAAFVATLPLKGIGEDCISIDPCDSVDFPNHITLLSAGLVNTENLKDLDALLGKEFTFITLPLKFENADGCSCRAVAMIKED